MTSFTLSCLIIFSVCLYLSFYFPLFITRWILELIDSSDSQPRAATQIAREQDNHYPNFFLILFYFCCSDWVISTILSSSWLICHLIYHLIFCWLPHYNYLILYFYVFHMFSRFLLKFSLCSSIVLLSLARNFITITLNSLWGKLLISVSFFPVFFYLVLSFRTYLSPHFVWLCVCFYETGKTATSLGHEGVSLV